MAEGIKNDTKDSANVAELVGRGISTKMRVKLAAKMLIIAWTLMKKNEVFDPAYLSSCHSGLGKSAFNPVRICIISRGTITGLSFEPLMLDKE